MAVFWNNLARFRWTPVLAVLLACSVAATIWQWHLRINGRNRTNAQLDLVMISDSLKSMSADSAVALSPDSVTNLNARDLYEMLSATNAGTYFLEHRKDWDQRQELVDPWGRPFHFQVLYPSGTTNCREAPIVRVRIWSSGPNGQDEEGTGDDIICQTVALRLRK